MSRRPPQDDRSRDDLARVEPAEAPPTRPPPDPTLDGLPSAGAVGPKYRRLEQSLREAIKAGRLRPGDRLPPEPELAASEGMARMTARRAIEALVADGLLRRAPGRGTFVAERRFAYPPATLFSFSKTMAALGLPVETRLLDVEVIDCPEDVAEDLDVATGTPILLVRRLRSVNGEPVAIHASYMAARFREGLLADDLLRRPISEAIERMSGIRVIASRDYLSADAASGEEAELLRIAPGSPVQRITGSAYPAQGQPILATRAVYRGDRFRFILSARADTHAFELTRLDSDRS